MDIVAWAQEAVFIHTCVYCIYWTIWDRYMQVLYLGRAPSTKETLPDFLKWRRVTRPPLVFRGLTGSQRTPGFWGVTHCADQVIRRCVPEDEMNSILNYYHTLPCGGHFGGQRTAAKVLQSGFYWPTLFKNAHQLVSTCDKCQ